MNREKLARIIWEVEAEDDGRFAVGVASEAAHNIADRILPLLEAAWDDGNRAGWGDRTRSFMGRRSNEEEAADATPNPYRSEA